MHGESGYRMKIYHLLIWRGTGKTILVTANDQTRTMIKNTRNRRHERGLAYLSVSKYSGAHVSQTLLTWVLSIVSSGIDSVRLIIRAPAIVLLIGFLFTSCTVNNDERSSVALPLFQEMGGVDAPIIACSANTVLAFNYEAYDTRDIDVIVPKNRQQEFSRLYIFSVGMNELGQVVLYSDYGDESRDGFTPKIEYPGVLLRTSLLKSDQCFVFGRSYSRGPDFGAERLVSVESTDQFLYCPRAPHLSQGSDDFTETRSRIYSDEENNYSRTVIEVRRDYTYYRDCRRYGEN